MKRDEQNIRKVLDRYLGRYGEPPREHVDSAVEHVRQRLHPEIAHAPGPATLDFHARKGWLTPVAAAAVAVAIIGSAVLVQNIRPRKPAEVIAELSDGKLIQAEPRIRPNERLRSGEGGALIALADRSRVEVRAQSELAFERAGDGIRIRLYKGGVIVTAAKQGQGHLYVQTRDMTVSVLGTVFLVNAEEEGSRVAVIQGEVQVQQDATAKKLIPGQQVATSPSMELRPVREEISWSRHAEEHFALLQQSAVPESKVTQPAQHLEFAVISIKPISGDIRSIMSSFGSLGFACHGTDGVPRAPFRGGPEIPVPLGRCVGIGVNLAWLMNYAYESPWRYGPNVPDWAKSTGELGQEPARFQIEAAAQDPSAVTTAQLRQMLQAMLADRFKLRVHRETQGVQGYALVLAKNGPKLKEATGELEPPHFGPGPGIKGKSSLDELAQYLPQFVIAFANLGFLDGPFVNKTGLMGIYEYEFQLSRSGGGGGGARGEVPAGGPPTRLDRAADTVAAISGGMESQLGIRIQPEKIPADVIVIDQVEKPSAN
jgi:uncharacterized protein (TIGR03435 family)